MATDARAIAHEVLAAISAKYLCPADIGCAHSRDCDCAVRPIQSALRAVREQALEDAATRLDGDWRMAADIVRGLKEQRG